jgi:hypothetical protein
MKARAFIIFTFILIAGLGAATPWALTKAPYENRYDECVTCGRARMTTKKWGDKPVEKIETLPHSVWFDQFLPAKHVHQWVTSSTESRSEWFGSEVAACGGLGVISSLHYAQTKVGAQAVKPLVAEYLELAKTAGYNELVEFRQHKVTPLTE